MKRPGPWLIAPLLLSMLLAGTATGQGLLQPSDLPEREQQLLQSSPEQLLNRLVSVLQRHGPDRVATPATAARLTKIARGQQRVQFIGQFLSMDLDGDGAVTDDEAQVIAGPGATSAAENSQTGRQLARLRASLEEVDTDRDGRATFDEISAYADRRIAALAGQGRGNEPVDMMIFDLNQDARVDAAEITKAVTMLAVAQAGAGGSASGVGTPANPACPAPPPLRDSQFVLLGTSRGGALATVATGSLQDFTTVVRVHIDAGAMPLSVIAASRGNVIWKLSWATGRVRQFTVQVPQGRIRVAGDAAAREVGPESGAGVIGLAPDVVSFVPAMSCLTPFGSPDDSAAVIAAARLAAQFGRPLDQVMAHSGAGSIALPSGVVRVSARGLRGHRVLIDGKQHIVINRKPVLIDDSMDHAQAPGKPSADTGLQQKIARSFPEGVMKIDPAEVVAPGPVVAYAVLPGQAGLLQLIEAGLIRRVKDGFLIVKPIPQFPPGLAGGNSVKFILATGVPMPEGDPGHSSVISQQTGACLLGVRCQN